MKQDSSDDPSGTLPSSPPEYDNLYDPMNGGGMDPLHDELLQMCRVTGLEDIARDSGLIKNGEIPSLKDYSIRDHAQQSHKQTPTSTKNITASHSTPPAILSHSNHKSGNHTANTTSTTTTTTTTTTTHTDTKIDNHKNNCNLNTTHLTHVNNSNNNNIDTPRHSSFQPPTPVSSTSNVQSGDDSGDEGAGKKRKRGGGSSFKADKEDKGGHNKGLRHFSLKVCQKVETKRTTSYNEVADELVGEIQANSEQVVTPVEQKNIRRRVYDVLNVLMAMNKKEIHWIGLPTETKKPYDEYKKEKAQRLERIKKKKESLAELMAQQVSFRNLLARNTKPDFANTQMKNRIYLPFIVVNTKSQTVINCEVAHDRTKYFFNFSNPFEIYDDNEVLKRMGLGSCIMMSQELIVVNFQGQT